MNIEITDLDMILNYLETTSLEPHDDYSSEFTYKDQKILYKYIKQLQQENKQLKDNWDKLKEYFNERIEVCDNRLSSPFCNFEKATKERLIFSQCLEKLEELEQGRDNQ
jgi:hypothetical protein|nr:MAG TPA: Protein AF-10, Histone-lysine N-methyltransferase, H3, hAF10, Leucine zipper, heterodimer.6A [Caudoviricetes sp.]